MKAAFISILTVALVAGLYYLIIGKLVRGLRCFSRFAGQWKSEKEDQSKVDEANRRVIDYVLYGKDYRKEKPRH